MRKITNFQSKISKVTIISPENTYIEEGVIIGEGCVIYPNNYIEAGSVIGKNCILYPSNYVEKTVIGNNCTIGPFCHIRTNCSVKNNIRLGNFCEIKSSIIGSGTKIAHLCYVGDAVIGDNCNIGCGVVFANYNGQTKQQTIIGDNCFIGCNSNLIAPLIIGKSCYIGAGTTLFKNLDDNKFVLGNRDLIIKENLQKMSKKQ